MSGYSGSDDSERSGPEPGWTQLLLGGEVRNGKTPGGDDLAYRMYRGKDRVLANFALEVVQIMAAVITDSFIGRGLARIHIHCAKLRIVHRNTDPFGLKQGIFLQRGAVKPRAHAGHKRKHQKGG